MRVSQIYFRNKNKFFSLVSENPSFKYGEKIYSLTCIVGKNGAGKTRFLNQILENRSNIDLIFEDVRRKIALKKSGRFESKLMMERVAPSEVRDDFCIIKYSSAIEYKIPNPTSICYDESTSHFLQIMRLNELNRHDTVNQIAVVAKYLSDIESLISFKDKTFKVTLASEGEAISKLSKKYFNSTMSKYTAKIFEKNLDRNLTVLKKKFLSILFDEINIDKQEEAKIKSLFSNIDLQNFSVNDDFYDQLSLLASPTFSERVKKFFDVYERYNFENIFRSGKKHRFYNDQDIMSLNAVIDYFFPEIEPSEDSLIKEVLGVLTFSWIGLSSGEISILNLLGRLYSGKMHYGEVTNKLLLIDEVDLGLHPEWQRLWVSDVLPLIAKILCTGDQKIQVIITTHSPIILSDIYTEDIIIMPIENENLGKIKKTFAQNIYTLYNNTFFLKRLIGEYAHRRIENTITFLNNRINKNFTLNNENFYYNLDEENQIITIDKIIESVGEPIIAKQLLELYELAYPNIQLEMKKKRIRERINTLEEELRKLNEGRR